MRAANFFLLQLVAHSLFGVVLLAVVSCGDAPDSRPTPRAEPPLNPNDGWQFHRDLEVGDCYIDSASARREVSCTGDEWEFQVYAVFHGAAATRNNCPTPSPDPGPGRTSVFALVRPPELLLCRIDRVAGRSN